jgi:ferredoxin
VSARERAIITTAGFELLLDAIKSEGFELVGPTIREGAVVYDRISGVTDLPAGWTDEQDGGTYRLVQRDDKALFGYTGTPQSWKRFLMPPRLRLWTAERNDDRFEIVDETSEPPKLALLAVRSCELHAIAIQDRVFLGGSYVDRDYQARRERVLIVAVQCGRAGGTCFCVSMGTGPRVVDGYDLVLTELIDAARHEFLIEAGTDRGARLLAALPNRAVEDDDVQQAEAVLARTAASMGRSMDTTDIHDLLLGNLEHPRWNEVADRCLACTNCTLVCPTCFCTSVEDVTDLHGERAERWRRWDSCFTSEFSRVGAGSVRPAIRSRYRQWMTHKLATWYDQFGSSGCVGCGRCVTWCPVGIDITEEVAAIRATDARKKENRA